MSSLQKNNWEDMLHDTGKSAELIQLYYDYINCTNTTNSRYIFMQNIFDHVTNCNSIQCNQYYCNPIKDMLEHYHNCQNRTCPTCSIAKKVEFTEKIYNAITLSIRQNNVKNVMEFFKKININVNSKHEGIPLICIAIEHGARDILNFFMTLPSLNINAICTDGNTGLHIAVQFGHTDILKLLLKQQGINKNIQNKDGKIYTQMENLFPKNIITDNQLMCQICFEDYKADEEKVTMGCGHTFCMHHIDAISKRQTCPLCKKHCSASLPFSNPKKLTRVLKTACAITTEEASFTDTSLEPFEKKRKRIVHFEVMSSPEDVSTIEIVSSSNTSSVVDSLNITSEITSPHKRKRS